MEKEAPAWTLGSIAAMLGGEAVGPADLPIRGPVNAGSDDPAGITFAESDAYLQAAEASGVGAVIVGPDVATSKPSIRVQVPRLAFFKLLHLAERPMTAEPGVHATAVVDPSATVEEGASVGPFAVIGPHARVEAGAIIGPHCVVGDRSAVGAGTRLYPRVTLYQDVILGRGCTVHSGVVIGADGFGFVWDGRTHVKVPQVGGVRIGDQVEIGANTCIDRATAGDTVIESGSKLDNLIQVGHNGRIGKHVIIAGQSGISGSVTIGDRSVLGGGVGTNDHVVIGADVKLGGRSGVDKDILEPGEYFGTPARPAREALKAFVLTTKLPEIWQRLRRLERMAGDQE